jgi:protein tyrosine/serine phosphatase
MQRTAGSLAILAAVLAIAGPPLLYHRYHLTTHKRFREVVPGRFYRSGQMTADGLADAIRKHRIRTVIDVQNEFDDPELRISFLNPGKRRESDVCRELGVRFINLDPDLVSRRDRNPRPKVIESFLAIMDDPANYPLLLHCKAGLHRTGVLAAVYRMEYQGWNAHAAVIELKRHGFGDSACTSANDYIEQYVLRYRPRASTEVKP